MRPIAEAHVPFGCGIVLRRKNCHFDAVANRGPLTPELGAKVNRFAPWRG